LAHRPPQGAGGIQLLRRELQPAQKTLEKCSLGRPESDGESCRHRDRQWRSNARPLLRRELQPPKTTFEGMRRKLQPQRVFMDCRHRDRQRRSHPHLLLRRELQPPKTTLEGLRRGGANKAMMESIAECGINE